MHANEMEPKKNGFIRTDKTSGAGRHRYAAAYPAVAPALAAAMHPVVSGKSICIDSKGSPKGRALPAIR